MIDNVKIDEKERSVVISINPEIYPLQVIYSAAYVMMDRAYIVLDGNPREEVIVKIKAKHRKEHLETLSNDFHNELLNYAVYKSQSEQNKELRETILKRVLLTNINIDIKDSDSPDDYIKDPEGIMKPRELKDE